MAATTQDQDVRIHEPDRGLQIKVGMTNLDQVFTPKLVEESQTLIEESAESFWEESLVLMESVKKTIAALQTASGNEGPALKQLVDDAFAIKTKTGIGGYTLITALAKSLQHHAECAQKDGLSAKLMAALKWHIDSMEQFFTLRLKGDGGATGAAIMKELARLEPNQKA